MRKNGKLPSALLLLLILFSARLAQSDKKTAYGILVDNTGSMRSQFANVHALSKGLIERLHQRGPISLFDFTSAGDKKNPVAIVAAKVEWSQDKHLLENTVDDLFVIGGQTALLDAIYSIAESVNAKVNLEKDAFADKAIFLITDGENRTSKIKEKQLIEKLKESGIKVYAIGLVQQLDSEFEVINRSKKEKAIDFLKKAAQETGGRAVFPKSGKMDVNSIINELFAEPSRK